MCACGVDGQYRLSVTIGDKEDFLTDDKFISFTLVEKLGLSLPYFELVFDNVYPELSRYFNETAPILIQLGTNQEDLEPINFTIKVPIIMPKSADCSQVTLRGFLNNVDYLETELVNIYEEKMSLELAQIIAKRHEWSFKTNLSTTNDKMTYYQPNYSDYRFLFNEWLHSYYKDNDIILPAISSKKVLSYNSLSDLIHNTSVETMLTFVDSNPENNEIIVNANTSNDSGNALQNSFGNYIKTRDIYNIDTGLTTHVDVSNTTPIISESKNTSINESISKSSGFYVQSSNVHSNYYKQELINIQKFMSIQSSCQWISTIDTLIKNLYPGDLCLYMSKKENGQVNDQTSGLYLVTKRVVDIRDRHVHTNLQLSRENLNYAK